MSQIIDHPQLVDSQGSTIIYQSIQKLAYTRREASKVTGVSLNQIKEAVSIGELKAKKKGREWIITAADLIAWVAS